MQYSTQQLSSPIQLDFLLFDQFSNHCLANALEPFRAANTLSGKDLYQWKFYTPDGGPVTSSSGLPIIANGKIDDRNSEDVLFVLSGYGHLELDTPRLRHQLKIASAKATKIIALDSAAWLMASAGLLDGRRATVHNELLDQMAEKFLKVSTVRTGFVIDGSRITCGGAMAAFDLVLELIGNTHGQMLKLDIAALFLHKSHSQIEPASATNATTHTDGDIVTNAIAIMRNNIETPWSIAKICRELECNIKTLERQFCVQLGQSPSQVARHIRLVEIRRLIENTNLPITEIGIRGGYKNASAMARACKNKFNLTPRQLRRISVTL